MTDPRSRPLSVRPVALLLCALLALLPAAAQPAAKSSVPLGADSPEALVKRLKTAAEKQDVAELAACMASSDRAMMTMMMVLAVTMMTAFTQMGSEMATGLAEGFQDEESMTAEEKAEAAAAKKKMEDEGAAVQKKLEAVLAKHGITELMEQTPDPEPGSDPTQNAEKLLAGVDQVALISDITALMKENFKDAEKAEGSPTPPIPNYTMAFGEVKQGDLEDLKVKGDTASVKVGGEEVQFVKVDGRWYVKLLDNEIKVE
ncbi:MAG TPA: hypothetical protein VNJ70_15640 [Thermoanaerobaculia bacterium]|nr:hypothetical protein [Thermoanaerobaculia bacterium]